jgi:hypothetical protein
MKIQLHRQIFEKDNHQIWWKSVQWEPGCPIRTDTPIDTMRLIVAIRNFSKAPKSSSFHDAVDNKTNIKKNLKEMESKRWRS